MMPAQRIRKAVFWLGLAVPTAGLLATSWLAHETSGQFNGTFALVTRTYKVLNIIEDTQAHAADAETGQRGYFLTGRKDYFATYDTAIGDVNNNIQQLKAILRDNPVQQTNLNDLQNMVTRRLSLDPGIAASGKTNSASSLAVALTDQGWDTMNQIRSVLFQMRAHEADLLTARQQDAEAKFLFNQTASFILVGLTAMALVAVVFILIRLEKLQQIVTVCAWTGQVKHEGEWIRMDEYLHRRFGFSVTHGMSQEAASKMVREIQKSHAPPNPP
ncbi:MAG TPA: CHASE3 domain-containing protein [Verrucomicrobiae bacterium]|jgi:CHASE3 domain sensor protein